MAIEDTYHALYDLFSPKLIKLEEVARADYTGRSSQTIVDRLLIPGSDILNIFTEGCSSGMFTAPVRFYVFQDLREIDASAQYAKLVRITETLPLYCDSHGINYALGNLNRDSLVNILSVAKKGRRARFNRDYFPLAKRITRSVTASERKAREEMLSALSSLDELIVQKVTHVFDSSLRTLRETKTKAPSQLVLALQE